MKKLLQEWYVAHKEAEENPRRLLEAVEVANRFQILARQVVLTAYAYRDDGHDKEWLTRELAKLQKRIESAAVAGHSTEEYKKASDICCANMRRVYLADEQLYALNGNKDIPPLVQLFIDSRYKGCASCWASSKPGGEHPECARLIAEFFGYQAALMAYIGECYIRFNTIEVPFEDINKLL